MIDISDDCLKTTRSNGWPRRAAEREWFRRSFQDLEWIFPNGGNVDGPVRVDIGLRRRGRGGRFLGRLAPPGMHPVAEAIADGQLIAVLAEYESGSLPVYIVLPPGNSFPIKLRAFLDFTMARLGSRLRSLA